MKKEVAELKQRVEKAEKGKGSGKSSGKDFLDPAPKRVEFKKFKAETSAAQRLKAMKAFRASYPGPAPLAFGNNYSGPYNNRVLKDSGFAEFTDQDAVRVFLDSAEKVVEVQGVAVQVQRAKTKMAKQRDWALYTAKDLVTEAAGDKVVEVLRDGGQRTVTVNSEVAFVQTKEDSRGSFVGDFARLSLPR